ncbi:MAG: nucleotidyltransferase domain-containing protein [Defluviitaleaceae bacterium]|nr:nucleotidyltransferase domain-containing protein [Defluviitaleaceae bacterium]
MLTKTKHLTVDAIKQLIAPIVESSPVKTVILFGSHARKSNSDDSDIDLVIDSEGQLRGINFFAFASDLADALPIKTDIYESREIKKNSALHREILKEGVVVYER